MAAIDSSYTSWADQWDPNPEYGGPASKKSGGGGSSYGKKVGEGFGKTKAVASTGVKKVKQGTSLGFNWIKDKYQKTTNRH